MPTVPVVGMQFIRKWNGDVGKKNGKLCRLRFLAHIHSRL
jgi:hypothetical protein